MRFAVFLFWLLLIYPTLEISRRDRTTLQFANADNIGFAVDWEISLELPCRNV